MSVKMSVRYGESDGPIAEVMPKDTEVIFHIMKDDKEAVSFAFDFDQLGHENQQRISLYGLNKLLTDRTSDQKDKFAKLDEMQVVFDMLVEGEWAKERVVGAPVVSCEVQALAEIMSLSVPETQASLAAYPKEQRAQILAHDRVVAIATTLREKRKTGVLTSLDEYIA